VVDQTLAHLSVVPTVLVLQLTVNVLIMQPILAQRRVFHVPPELVQPLLLSALVQAATQLVQTEIVPILAQVIKPRVPRVS
jgi:hypothetical protein